MAGEKEKHPEGIEANAREPQGDWKQAHTYEAGCRAKDEQDKSTSSVKADLADRAAKQDSETGNLQLSWKKKIPAGI